MITKDKRLFGIVTAVALLLCIPLVAMLFTDEVNWDLTDFLVAGFLLLGTGLTCEFVLRQVPKTEHRIGIIVVILLVLFLVWAELAVGLFGTPFAGS